MLRLLYVALAAGLIAVLSLPACARYGGRYEERGTGEAAKLIEVLKSDAPAAKRRSRASSLPSTAMRTPCPPWRPCCPTPSCRRGPAWPWK